MSIAMSVAAWESKLPAMEKFVLVACAEYVGCGDDDLLGEGEWNERVINKLSVDTSLPVDRVMEVLDKLRKRGIITDTGANYHNV